jgi:hypothetical protein
MQILQIGAGFLHLNHAPVGEEPNEAHNRSGEFEKKDVRGRG